MDTHKKGIHWIVTFRLEADLKPKLEIQARKNGRSVNKEVNRILAESVKAIPLQE